MERLLLTIPTQQRHRNPAVELKPKKVTQWLDELPVLNPMHSVNALLDAVTQLNEQQLDTKERLRLLELYRVSINTIFDSFDGDSVRRLPISVEQRGKVKEDIQRLCAELANGYKIIVKSQAQSNVSLGKDPRALLAVYRSMEQLARVLLQAYRIYAAVPMFVYLELYQLFHYAQQQKVASKKIADVDNELMAPAVEPLFLQTLLASIADPFRLGEGEILPVFRDLQPYLQYCTITQGVAVEPGPSRFVFHYGADSPPKEYLKELSQESNLDAYLLDVTKFANVAQAQLNAWENDPQRRDTHQAHVLRIILPHIREKKERRVANRAPVHREVKVTVGVEAIHYYLEDGGRRLIESDKQQDFGIEVHNLDDESEQVYLLDSWVIVNESVKGYLLTRKAHAGLNIQVGDVAGLHVRRAESKQRVLSVAVVRWLRKQAGDKLEMGIEILPGNPKPVTCSSHAQPEPLFPTKRCIFFPNVKALKLPATLLTPKKVYAQGRVMNVRSGLKSVVVQARYLVMDTACFDRFDFIATDETSTTTDQQ